MHEALTIKAECSTVAHTSARDRFADAEKRFWGAISV